MGRDRLTAAPQEVRHWPVRSAAEPMAMRASAANCGYCCNRSTSQQETVLTPCVGIPLVPQEGMNTMSQALEDTMVARIHEVGAERHGQRWFWQISEQWSICGARPCKRILGL